jgi:hypothetical protein
MSRTGSGIAISRSADTSCLMISIGNSGARSAGPIGLPVPGWRTGGSGFGRSAWMLYQLRGMSFSASTYLTVSSAIGCFPSLRRAARIAGRTERL